MIDRKTLANRIWTTIDVEENIDATQYDDANILIGYTVCSLVADAFEHQDISEHEFMAYMDYQKEQIRRIVFGAKGSGSNDVTKTSKKQKDFGDKRDLK